MTSSVTLGNFFSSGGKTVVGGAGGSGIDTESLINALVAAKSLPATQKQDQITLNDSKISALSDFQTLLAKFSTAASVLSNPPGVGNDADNAFKYTTSNVTTNNSEVAANYLTVATSPGATLTNYTISNITSLAAAKKQNSGVFNIASADTAVVSSSPAAGQFGAGTFTLKGQSITFNNGDSLNSITAKINAVSSTTGITANIIKISDNQYQLSFAATATGTNADFDLNNVSPAGTLVDASGVFSHVAITTAQPASNAQFDFNGTTVTRQSNSVSDLVSGVTFTVTQTTTAVPSTKISVDIQPDQSTIKSNILTMLDAYNDLKIFAAKQMQVGTDGTYLDTALLHDDTTFNSTMNQINSQLSSVVSGLSSGGISSLADIGITYTDQAATGSGDSATPAVSNIFTVDDAKLTAALSSDPAGVANLFEFNMTTDNNSLRVFSRTNSIGTSAFSLSVNPFATQTTQTFGVNDADTPIVSDTPTPGMLTSGTITINGQAITLDNTDTLNTIASKFAAVSGASGIAASIGGSAGAYTLNFTSTPNGSGQNFDLTSAAIDPTGVFANAGITATGSYKATYDNGSGPVTIDMTATPVQDANTGVISSYSLSGKDGTVLAGLVLVYASPLASTANVTITQGIADKVFNVTDPVLTPTTGNLALDVSALQDSDTRLTTEIATINDQVDTYRQSLLDKFARMEQAISSVNTLLASIQANDDARNAAAGN